MRKCEDLDRGECEECGNEECGNEEMGGNGELALRQ
jgi:hypothetical protein